VLLTRPATLEEKVSQMMNDAAPVEPLAVPRYDWWNEALHGVARAGDEVVELYLTDVAASVPVPVRSLQGLARVTLKPGERRRVSFKLEPRQLSLIDERGRRVVEPGEFTVSVGGKQPGFNGRADAQTTGTVSGRFVVTGEAFEIPER
jgi:beta-glucosidase